MQSFPRQLVCFLFYTEVNGILVCLVGPQQVSLMKKYIVLTIKILGGPEIGGPMLKLFSLIENPHLVLSATLSRPYCVTLLRKTLY